MQFPEMMRDFFIASLLHENPVYKLDTFDFKTDPYFKSSW